MQKPKKQKQSKDKRMKEVNWQYLIFLDPLGAMDAHGGSLTYCFVNRSSWIQPTG